MENQNEKANDVNGTDDNGKAQEPETVITTKEALKAIGHNAKAKAKETWTKAKPKLKKAAIAVAVVGGAAYAWDKLNQQPALEQKDNDWTDDDIVDSEGTVLSNVDGEGTFTPKEDEPAENAE